MNSRKKGSVITDAMLREFTKNTPKYAAALTTPIGGIVAASTLLLGTLVAKNVEKGEAIKNSTIDSEEIKKILKENLATVKINIKNKKKAIAQLEQEIVDEETKIKSLEYLLKNIDNGNRIKFNDPKKSSIDWIIPVFLNRAMKAYTVIKMKKR